MTLRKFNKLINDCSKEKGKYKTINPKKIKVLSDEVKKEALYFLTKKRVPILIEFIPEGDNEIDSWLNSSGYLYTSSMDKDITIRHTCEHNIRGK